MLLGDFFTINAIQIEGNSIRAILGLNAMHPIFEGHFPGQPVLPGACMLQIIKEILQTYIHTNIQLVKGHQLKFISPISPSNTGILQLMLRHAISENNEIAVSATLSNNAITCFKFSGIFQSGK